LTITPSIKKYGIGDITFIEKIGESVHITADVANDSSQEKNYDIYLKIDGRIKDVSEINIGPQQSTMVKFTISDNEIGEHIVQISTLSGEFHTWTWVNWWVIGALIVILALLCWIIWTYFRRKRRRINKPSSANQLDTGQSSTPDDKK
jgi:hypothetical protein